MRILLYKTISLYFGTIATCQQRQHLLLDLASDVVEAIYRFCACIL